jgi:hypothetical protein
MQNLGGSLRAFVKSKTVKLFPEKLIPYLSEEFLDQRRRSQCYGTLDVDSKSRGLPHTRQRIWDKFLDIEF